MKILDCFNCLPFSVPPSMLQKFEDYFLLLSRWNSLIPLVQRRTLEDFLTRHVVDSLQIIPFIDKKMRIIDIGSGAGFPGMVLGIYGYPHVTLLDRNRKKVMFLEEANRLLMANVNVRNESYEDFSHDYDVAISRACAPLESLLSSVSRETRKVGIFHKGSTYLEEIEGAKKFWDFRCEIIRSCTHPEGRILIITESRKK